MNKILLISILLVILTACVTQSTVPTSEPILQSSQSQESVATNSPQQAQGKNQGTRAPQQQNTPVPRNTPQAKQSPQNSAPRQTPQTNSGSDATQNQTLDIPAHPIDIILGRPTQRSMTASVLAYQDGEAYIEFGTQTGAHPNKTTTRALTKNQPAEILIEALQPNTQYYYQLFYRAGNSGAFTALAEKSFYTQRTPGSTFTFDIQADSHLDSNSNLDVYARTLANASADKPDFFIDLGDTFMSEKYQPYTTAQKQYLAQRYFLGTLAPSPLFLVIGNHDGEDAPRGNATNDMQVWSAKMRTQYFPNPTPNDFYSGNATPDKNVGALQDYYSWEWGDALFVVLDPYWFTPPARGTSDNWSPTLGAVQYQWLKKTLETSRAKWKFVFIHQLVGGLEKDGRGGVEGARLFEWGGNNADGTPGFALKRPGWAMPIHQLLVANKVTAVFHGHDHLFVKQELDGIIYQEVPQPSAARYDQVSSAKEYGYVTGDVLPSSGHLCLTVSSSQVKVDYVRAYLPQDENAQRKNGKVDYTYTMTAR
jgi:predicted phosphodiesterase